MNLDTVYEFRKRTYEDGSAYIEQGVRPEYSPEEDSFRFVVTEIGGTSADAGQSHRIVSLSADGTIETVLVFTTGDDPAESISKGCFLPGSLVLLTSKYGNQGVSFSLVKVDRNTGEIRREDGIERFFDNPFLRPVSAAASAEGICVITQQEAAVFDAEMGFLFSVMPGETVLGVSADGEGRFWLGTVGFNADHHAVRIDPGTKSCADSVPLPHGGNEFCFCGSLLCTASGGSLWTVDPEGGAEEVLFSYVNSGYMPSEFSVLSVPDRERIIGANTANGTFFTGQRSAADADYTVLTVAMTQGEDAVFSQNLVRFRRIHPETYINLLDYGEITEDEPDKGADRLKLELGTGTVSPDVLISGTENSSDSMWRYALEHDLLSDLSGTVNTEDRLGCTVRTFSDDQGRLLGLCRDFTVFFSIARQEETETYGMDRSAENALEFAEHLPEKSLSFPYPTQSGYQNFLYDKIVRFCMESDPVSFENDLFTRYLRLLATYPASLAEALNLPSGVPMMDVYGDVYLDYLNGSIHTYDIFLTSLSSWIGLQSVFNSDAFSILDGKAQTVSATFYSVFADSGRQELAAEFVRFMTDAEQGYLAGDAYTSAFWMGGIPASKAELKKQQTAAEGDWLCSMKTRLMRRAEAGVQPGAEEMKITATAEYFDRLTDYLDRDCASDVFRIPGEVSAIIQEEIGACLGGASSPEKCGENIESRVGIWLAEHR